MMVIDDDDYGKRVPIQLGTLHIDQIIRHERSPEEVTSLGKGMGIEHHISSSIGGRAVKLQQGTDFVLDQVKGNLKITKDVILQPFENCQSTR